MFDAMGGGVTLSGGEPLLQADFCAELLGELGSDLHKTLETSGYASQRDFERIIHLCDFVIMDIKLMDDTAHRRRTGVSNTQILSNARYLMESGVKHLFRTPLIPGITDTEENLQAIAAFIGSEPIELLPYNDLAPAKYAAVGRTYGLEIDPLKKGTPDLSIFQNATLRK
jgi:pyruvate formate lyase activating enzyme